MERERADARHARAVGLNKDGHKFQVRFAPHFCIEEVQEYELTDEERSEKEAHIHFIDSRLAENRFASRLEKQRARARHARAAGLHKQGLKFQVRFAPQFCLEEVQEYELSRDEREDKQACIRGVESREAANRAAQLEEKLRVYVFCFSVCILILLSFLGVRCSLFAVCINLITFGFLVTFFVTF